MTQVADALNQRAGWRDYYELTKPRVVALMVLTSLVGMCLATPGAIPWGVLCWGNLGIALAAGAAAAINHIADRYYDSKMRRTENRPVVKGRVSVSQGLIFSAVLGLAAMAILLLFVNALTAWLTVASLVVYAGIYSFYLKHATVQNIVIGGVAGAAPPLLGWCAVTGTCSAAAWILMLIIFVWTPPHFWALAIHRVDEYKDADIPMMPVVHGVAHTQRVMLQYVILLFAITLLPFAIGLSGWLYLLAVIPLNLGFLIYVVAIGRGKRLDWPMRTFRYSILYLMILFVALLVDHYI